MEETQDTDIQLNYEQVINRHLDRIASTSAKEFSTLSKKNQMLEWELAVLEALIPDEILGEIDESNGNGDDDTDEKKISRTKSLVQKLKVYINRLSEKGILFNVNSHGEPKRRKKTSEVWDQ